MATYGLRFTSRMTGGVSRRFLLSGLAALGASPVFAGAPSRSLFPQARPLDFARRVEPSAADLIARAQLSGTVSFALADTATGAVLESHRGQAKAPPASVAKILTALYALDRLGAEHRFETRLLATGSVRDGVIDGDLVLDGGGDPGLDTDALAGMAASLKAAGIREVRGRLRVHAGALPYVRSIDPKQPDHVGYSPSVSGLALNYNRVHFEWRRAAGNWRITMDARTRAYRPEVQMARMQIADRKTPVYTYADGGQFDDWTVASGALGNGGARWLPVRKPDLYAGEVFRDMARAHGIQTGAPSPLKSLPADLRVLVRHQGEPLHRIVVQMLKYSNNLTAEMVGLSASIAGGARPVSLRDSGREMNRWAQETLGMASAGVVDHSGLGDASRFSAEDLARVLAQPRVRALLAPMLKEIPVRDERGRPLKSAPISITAKTGTLNFVSGLGGYVRQPDGRPMAFAIFMADTDQRARIPKSQRERPPGGRAWARRARALQQALLLRWGRVHTA